MHILLAEDDRIIADGLVRALRKSGFAVDHVASGSDADAALLSQQFDLLILDLGLPRLNGIEVLKRLRARKSPLPVLILTAQDGLEDRVRGLDAGADDYLTKPFALPELAARIEAVLKRSRAGGRRLLTVADLAYDLDTLEVTRAGQPLKVGPIGLKLLAVLMQKSPAVATREALESALWGDAPPDSDSLRSHIHTLRQQIDKPFPKPLLHTVHGVGFRLADAGENN